VRPQPASGLAHRPPSLRASVWAGDGGLSISKVYRNLRPESRVSRFGPTSAREQPSQRFTLDVEISGSCFLFFHAPFTVASLRSLKTQPPFEPVPAAPEPSFLFAFLFYCFHCFPSNAVKSATRQYRRWHAFTELHRPKLRSAKEHGTTPDPPTVTAKFRGEVADVLSRLLQDRRRYYSRRLGAVRLDVRRSSRPQGWFRPIRRMAQADEALASAGP
jgi:hypothetical protein